MELKRISEAAVGAALDKAERYRLLNDPGQAESICLDVLDVAPGDLRAKRILLLALTDRFAEAATASRVKVARKLAGELSDEYERLYYEGIVWEREGRSYLAKGLSGSFAYECLHEAMERFDQAAAIRPEGNDDPILRWNSCLRTIREQELGPRDDTGELPLE